jgi:hypothetical protein
MFPAMAVYAKRNQIIDCVRPQAPAILEMVDLQVDRTAAALAFPSIALQHAKPQQVIFLAV